MAQVTGKVMQIKPSYFSTFMNALKGDVSKVPVGEIVPVGEVKTRCFGNKAASYGRRSFFQHEVPPEPTVAEINNARRAKMTAAQELPVNPAPSEIAIQEKYAATGPSSVEGFTKADEASFEPPERSRSIGSWQSYRRAWRRGTRCRRKFSSSSFHIPGMGSSRIATH